MPKRARDANIACDRMHMSTHKGADTMDSQDELTRRSLGIMLAQTRASAVALTLAGPLYGVVLVPRVGWLPWLGWYFALVASLLVRQRYFTHLVTRDGY